MAHRRVSFIWKPRKRTQQRTGKFSVRFSHALMNGSVREPFLTGTHRQELPKGSTKQKTKKIKETTEEMRREVRTCCRQRRPKGNVLLSSSSGRHRLSYVYIRGRFSFPAVSCARETISAPCLTTAKTGERKKRNIFHQKGTCVKRHDG